MSNQHPTRFLYRFIDWKEHRVVRQRYSPDLDWMDIPSFSNLYATQHPA
jgi:hypothetical protein